MRRREKKIISVLLACMMLLLPAGQAFAAKTYSAADGLNQQMLFPGDSIAGIAAPFTIDGQETGLEADTWTNQEEGRVYAAATNEDGSVSLTAAGYVLTVVSGTASLDGQDDTGRHYVFEEGEQSGDMKTDVACYQPGETVRLTAEAPAENMEFTGWSADTEGVSFEDSSAMDTTMVMIDKEVTVTASYQEIQEPVEEGSDTGEETGEEVVTGGEEEWVDNGEGGGTGEEVVTGGEEEWVDNGEGGGTANGENNGGYVSQDGSEVVISDGTDLNTSGSPEDPSSLSTVYEVYVNDGTGGGSYGPGVQVTVTANDRSMEGFTFAGWYVDSMNAGLDDPSALQTTFIMPEEEVIVSATYTAMQSDPVNLNGNQSDEPQVQSDDPEPTDVPQDQTGETGDSVKYAVTINNGSGAGEFAAGETVSIEAFDRTSEGYQFAGWFAETEGVVFDNVMSPATFFAMPAADVIVTATYTEIQSETGQSETVQSETGQSETVQSETDQSETVQSETGQSETVQSETGQSETVQSDTSQSETAQSDTSQSETVQSESAESDTNMIEVDPAQTESTEPVQTEPVEVTYQVNVENGIGSGEYAAGETVTIEAEEESGLEFDGWETDSSGVQIDDTQQAITTFVMPETDVSVTATYSEATFQVTIEDGTLNGNGTAGPQSYTAGTEVTVTADTAEEGLEFSHWQITDTATGTELENTDSIFDDMTGVTTTFVMPAQNVTVSAIYDSVIPEYTVTVGNGQIDGVNRADTYTFSEGEEITVMADSSPYGKQFSHWEVNGGEYGLGDEAYNETMLITVDQNMDIVAVYEGIEYNVTVDNGRSNYSSCPSGTVVTIVANDPAYGMEFDYWEVDTGNVSLNNAYSSRTTFTMPDGDVEVTAHYKKVQYSVTVTNGTSDAQYYYAGDTVTVSSYYPASGREFNKWESVQGGVTFADSSRWKTTFTMPANNVSVKATYKNGPSTSDNLILDIVAGGEYYTTSKIKFTASGAGMSNTNPNPGDYRYRPASYQIGNVTGSWQSSPYTTTMSIKAAGDYTLKVVFRKEVYKNGSWTADGTTDTKSVNFRVVKNAAVNTGDETNLMTPIIIAAVSLGIFLICLIVFLVIFINRKKKR